MIYKCPNCAAALVFEPKKNRLICHSCDSNFRPEDINIDNIPKQHMNLNIYSCTACGGEIMVNANEAATYCIYCGQPVVVFDRVSSELQPDSIVPFKVTKEMAKMSIRRSLKKIKYAPKEFKNVKEDMIRGIYIPFWLYDINYYDKQYYSARYKTAGGTVEKACGYVYEARKMFQDLPINASSALDDEELQMLGEYRLQESVPFHAGYLSGFYADKYDIDYQQAAGMALEKAKELFAEDIRNSLYKRGYEEVFLRYSMPNVVLQGMSYTLIPVWCATFRYKGEPHTLFVNGQNGRVAGNFPLKKSYVARRYLLNALKPSLVMLPFFYAIYKSYVTGQMNFGIALMGILMYVGSVFGGFCFGRAFRNERLQGLNYSRSAKLQKYVKERQGE